MSMNIPERLSGGKVNGDMTVETIHLSDTESVPLAVVSVVSSLKDCDETELSPLGEQIDTDALNQLFSPTADSIRSKGHVEFRYEGCLVRVSSDGRVAATLD